MNCRQDPILLGRHNTKQVSAFFVHLPSLTDLDLRFWRLDTSHPDAFAQKVLRAYIKDRGAADSRLITLRLDHQRLIDEGRVVRTRNEQAHSP